MRRHHQCVSHRCVHFPLPCLLLLLCTAPPSFQFANGDDPAPTDIEMDGINHLVKGTKLMTILKEHADNHDKQLVLINEMVKSELEKLNTHFEGVVAEMEAKENLLLNHINAVEKRLEETCEQDYCVQTGLTP